MAFEAGDLCLVAELPEGSVHAVIVVHESASTVGESAAMAAMIGQFINNRGGVDAFDDGNITALLAAFETAYRKQATNFVATVGGTANALAVTLDPAPISNAGMAGMPLRLVLAAANTGPVPLNVNGFAALPVVNAGGSDLQVGLLQSGRIAEIACTGSKWIPLSALSFARTRLLAPLNL